MASTDIAGAAQPSYVAVVGPGDNATEAERDAARAAGAALARAGCIVVTGGLGGVMAAAADGAADAGGTSVGLLPGASRADAGGRLTVVLTTGLGEARNALVVGSADAVLAVGGSWGTLSEIALARRTGRPVVCIGGWQVTDGQGAPLLSTAVDAGLAVGRLLGELDASGR